MTTENEWEREGESESVATAIDTSWNAGLYTSKLLINTIHISASSIVSS